MRERGLQRGQWSTEGCPHQEDPGAERMEEARKGLNHCPGWGCGVSVQGAGVGEG